MWGRKDPNQTLEVPRSSGVAKTLDAAAYRPPATHDPHSVAEASSYEAPHAEAPKSGREAPPRLDDIDNWLTYARQTFFKLEARRHTAPGGVRLGMIVGLAGLAVAAIIASWIFGEGFWTLAAMVGAMTVFNQINSENTEVDYSAADPVTLSWPRRIALFIHPSFATSPGTIRNTILLTLFAIVMAVIF